MLSAPSAIRIKQAVLPAALATGQTAGDNRACRLATPTVQSRAAKGGNVVCEREYITKRDLDLPSSGAHLGNRSRYHERGGHGSETRAAGPGTPSTPRAGGAEGCKARCRRWEGQADVRKQTETRVRLVSSHHATAAAAAARYHQAGRLAAGPLYLVVLICLCRPGPTKVTCLKGGFPGGLRSQ